MPKTTFTINDKMIIDIDSVLFAEIAYPGAMGAAGIASIYIFEGERLKHYTFDVFKVKETASYNNLNKMFKIALKKQLLDYSYGGFGNHAFKNKNVKFERDDDSATLLLQKEHRRYKIKVSNMGVYSNIIADFAINPVDYGLVCSIINNNTKNLEDAEISFLKAYIDQCERMEKGMSWINIDVSDYCAAISLIKFNRGETVDDYDPAIDTEYSISSIQKYRLKYIVEKIGWTKLHRSINRFVKGRNKSLFAELDKILGEKQKISDKFMKIRNGKSDNTDLTSLDTSNLKNLFDYPTIINFEPSARKQIHEKILSGEVNLNANADSVAFYLMNYYWHLFDWGFDEIENVVWYIIDHCPNNDVNYTGVEKLFWVASHIINTHWKRLSGKENSVYEDKIVRHYSPRVGGLWPIIHYGEFKMNDGSAMSILNESIGFIVSVEPEKWLPGIKDFLLTDCALNSSHPAIKHFAEKLQGKIE